MTRNGRELKVVTVMTELYCRRHHQATGLCESCRDLLGYVARRIEACPLGAAKTSCRKCSIHCYSPSRRDEIRRVMRYSGPRMMVRHPLMALRHLIDEMP